MKRVRLLSQDKIKYTSISSISSSSLTALNLAANQNAQMLSDSLFSRGILQRQQLQEDVNFCLRDSDTALSVPSRSKLLNEISNNVMKALVIGYEPIVNNLAGQFKAYREQLDRAESVFDDGEIIEGVCGNETGAVCATKLKSEDSSTVKPMLTQDQIKTQQYLDLLESLLTRGFVQDTIALGGIYDRGYNHLLTMLKDNGCVFLPSSRPAPIDQDICLSLFDKTRKVPLPQPSKTQILNTVANAVFRAVLYGRRSEKEIVIGEIETMLPTFAKQYTGGNDKSQEILFLKTLIVLLRHGLSSAEGVNLNRIAFNGTKTIAFGLDYKYPKNGALDHIDDIDDIMSLRLFDTYQNAFQRVVECCFVETGRRPGGAQNNEVVMSLASWEKTLRVDLTEPLWKRNPIELAGMWSLADVQGDGSLTKVTKEQPKWLGGRSKEVQVELTRDGSVKVQLKEFEGAEWVFTPGPAHLDTLEFALRSRSNPEDLLKYVGFIDRGQRVESRFSKQPIRMTGRVISVENGVMRGSNRFIMALPRSRGPAKLSEMSVEDISDKNPSDTTS